MVDDRWLYAWALGYVPVGLASLLVSLYALSLGASAFDVGLLASTAAFAGVQAPCGGAGLRGEPANDGWSSRSVRRAWSSPRCHSWHPSRW